MDDMQEGLFTSLIKELFFSLLKRLIMLIRPFAIFVWQSFSKDEKDCQSSTSHITCSTLLLPTPLLRALSCLKDSFHTLL